MKDRFTKGIWYAENEEVFSDINGRTKIANCNLFQFCSDDMKNETKANARLIAAAPKMYNKLVSLYEAANANRPHGEVTFYAKDLAEEILRIINTVRDET